MSYTVKNNISFDEYNAVINKVIEDCFVDGVYSPALYELSLRTSLISAFAPNYDLSGCEDNNALWERVTSPDANTIIEQIQNLSELGFGIVDYYEIKSAIDNGINHRLRAIESSPMSLSDIALSKLFGVITDKIDSIDTDILNKDTIEALITADKESGKENYVNKLVDVMVEKGLVSKPNRATRRSNSKKNKSATNTKIVKIDNTKQEEREDEGK